MWIIGSAFVIGFVAFAIFGILKASYRKWWKPRTKTIKPSGTVSTMSGVSEGIHPVHKEKYVRRAKIGDNPCSEIDEFGNNIDGLNAEQLRAIYKNTYEPKGNAQFWRPPKEKSTTLRILPPFRTEVRWHHFIQNRMIQCGQQPVNGGGDCPICRWVSALDKYEDHAEARKLKSFPRYYCNVLVRGKIANPKIWGMSKALYSQLSRFIESVGIEDRSDVFDLDTGRDIIIECVRRRNGFIEYSFKKCEQSAVITPAHWMNKKQDIRKELDELQPSTEELYRILSLHRASQELDTRLCQKCGKSYTPTNPAQRFCSLDCGGIAVA